jgi:hypothetical protein
MFSQKVSKIKANFIQTNKKFPILLSQKDNICPPPPPPPPPKTPLPQKNYTFVANKYMDIAIIYF